ncbi:PIN domain-containing protein [Peptococcaceae bacterium 1198_IL3148]
MLDVLLAREPHFKDSVKVLEMVEIGEAKGYITANSITDIAYIIKRGGFSTDRIIEIIKHIMQILGVTSLTKTDILKALELGYKDLEDAIQTQCAKKIRAEYIITRNKRGFLDKSIKVCSPTEFIKELY